MTTFSKLTPNLLVADVERSLAFYTNVLGFDRGFTVPEQPPFVFGSVLRGPIEIFFNERETAASCQYNGLPEDTTNLAPNFNSGSLASDYSSDVVNFAAFMRLSAPPTPVPDTALTARGRQVFQNIGCQTCHIMTQTTGQSGYSGQSNVSFSPFSDFALHDMGTGLADGIAQGSASGREFRTAPLWGIGQRLFFLHDGRTADLYRAIKAHASNGSEANTVISNFEMLAPADQHALVDFLRSL